MTDERTDRATDERASDERAADATAANRRYEDWPVEGEPNETTYVGMVEGGGAWFYSENDERLFETEVDETNRRLLPASDERLVSSHGGFGEAVERLGDELGWESLSAFARKHLEGDDQPESDD